MLKITMVHKFVDHKFVYQYFFFYLCNQINLFVEAIMDRAFVYGMSVVGDNFTDRVKETKRLKLIDITKEGVFLEDPIFRMWMKGRQLSSSIIPQSYAK